MLMVHVYRRSYDTEACLAKTEVDLVMFDSVSGSFLNQILVRFSSQRFSKIGFWLLHNTYVRKELSEDFA
ncbi:hypothetical protein L6452_32464 [Arctium lappa]|uniref:Uncharacterized protein n=1 Tax=Arctium lappa TaxID=4217 RepID=A0ACB8Z5K0_ARCLA|nr:hypothetical protein L6452_32464 [Arctium lappa]